MIAKIYQLKLRKIAHFFSNCQRYYTKHFLVFYNYADYAETDQVKKNVQLAVIVPKKAVKLRVNRTQIKRQVYNLSLPLMKKYQANSKKVLQVALVTNKKIMTVDRSQLHAELKDIFVHLQQLQP